MYWILLCLIINGYAYKFNRIATIPQGSCEPVSVRDTDHNGWDELFINEGSWGVSVWEYMPEDGFKEVHRYRTSSDSAITSIIPWDVGDGDKDGLSEIICLICFHADSAKDGIPKWGMGIIESRTFHSFPDTVVWFDPTSTGGEFTDLDDDGKIEIFGSYYEWVNPVHWQWKGMKIWENQGNNDFVSVFTILLDTYGHPMPSPSLSGDFDGDGRKELFGAIGSPYTNNVRIWECIGDNEYRPIWRGSRRFVNLNDMWLGDDTDGDGMPEIFLEGDIGFAMYEATGNNTYKYVVIEPEGRGIGSSCGDIDGDGVEEVVLSLGSKFRIYKAVGNDEYERVGVWKSDTLIVGGRTLCHDFNKNGYDEIVISGRKKTILLEIDTTCLAIATKPPVFQSCNLTISPNPFKEVVGIKYQVADKGEVSLETYDVSGRLVKVLTKTQSPEPKAYTVVWDGRDDKGKPLPSGIYFCELRAENYRITRKLVLIR